MSGLTQAGQGGKFLNIVQGRIRQTVDKDTPNAKAREWETKDGKSGVKYELVYSKIEGYIIGISFKDGDWGEQLQVIINCDGEKFILNMPSDSRYALDFMKRLPAVELDRMATLTPYDVEDKDKRNVGIKIEQGNKTVRSFFFDYEKKKSINGMPEMTEKNPDSDDWKAYFIQVKKFLKRVVNERIVPKLTEVNMEVKEEINIKNGESQNQFDETSDLPF